jgi:hypothetical protein
MAQSLLKVPLLECKLVQPWWKTIRRFLKKLEVEPPMTEVLLLELTSVCQRHTCSHVFIVMLFTKAKILSQLRCP